MLSFSLLYPSSFIRRTIDPRHDSFKNVKCNNMSHARVKTAYTGREKLVKGRERKRRVDKGSEEEWTW